MQLHELAVFDGGVLDGLQALCAVYLLFLLVDIDAQAPVGAVGRLHVLLDVGGDETGYETEADTHHLVLAGRQTAQQHGQCVDVHLHELAFDLGHGFVDGLLHLPLHLGDAWAEGQVALCLLRQLLGDALACGEVLHGGGHFQQHGGDDNHHDAQSRMLLQFHRLQR